MNERIEEGKRSVLSHLTLPVLSVTLAARSVVSKSLFLRVCKPSLEMSCNSSVIKIFLQKGWTSFWCSDSVNIYEKRTTKHNVVALLKTTKQFCKIYRIFQMINCVFHSTSDCKRYMCILSKLCTYLCTVGCDHLSVKTL